MDRTPEIVSDLRSIAARRAALDRAELSLVSAARSQRVSWATIAEVLDLGSRQAAQQRYRRVATRVEFRRDTQVVEASHGTEDRQDHLRALRIPAHIHPTRLRLINAAATLLSERGYAATRMSDIADHAGIQPGSVYYHYRSKEGLIADVLTIGVARANQAVISAIKGLPASTSAIERLKNAMAAHLRAMVGLDAVARAHVFAYGQVPNSVKERVRPARRANAQLWRDLIQDAREEGALRPDIHPFLIQLFVVNTIDAAMNWSRHVTSSQELGNTLGRLVLEGVAT